MDSIYAHDPAPSPGQSRWVTVSCLPREANESWLRMLFAPVGVVEVVDFGVGEKAGSAGMMFATADQANAALQFNGFNVLGINLQVRPRQFAARHEIESDSMSLSRRPPFGSLLPRMRNSTGQMDNGAPTHKNLYVLNLPLDASTDQLTALFTPYGTVVHCVILAMLDAQARRRGFIDMSTANQAKEAIEALNGFVWNGYPIEVSYSIVQRSGGPFDAPTGRNVIKRNVPRNRFNTGPRRIPGDSSLEPSLMSGLAHQFGRQMNLDVHSGGVSDYDTGHRDEHEVENGGAVVDPFTIFIAGLDTAAIIDDDDFRTALEPYGSITAATLCRDENGISRGFGIVTFASQQSATNACESINGKVINGRRLTAHKYVYQPNGLQGSSAPFHTPSVSLAPSTTSFGRRPMSSLIPSPMALPTSNGFHQPSALQRMPVMPLRYNTGPSMSTSPMWPSSSAAPLGPVHRANQLPMGMLGAGPLAANGESWAAGSQRQHEGPASFFKANVGNRAVEIKPDLSGSGSRNNDSDAGSKTSNTASKGSPQKNASSLGEAFVHLPKNGALSDQPRAGQGNPHGRDDNNASLPSPHESNGGNNGMGNPQPVLTRTPVTHVSPWSTASSGASPNGLSVDGLSPQSTMSVSSTTSTGSQLKTPEDVRSRDSAGIWTQSQGQHGPGLAHHASSRSSWEGTPPTNAFNKHSNVTGSAILSLQSDIIDKSSRPSMVSMAPVGHEKASSPMRVAHRETRAGSIGH